MFKKTMATIVDVAVDWLACCSASCLLNGDLVLKVSTGVARWRHWATQTDRS